MKFDIDSARKAGYSDDEIADYLATQNKFDLSGAIESGYSSSDVIDFLSKPQGGKQDLPQDIAPSEGRSATPMGQADPRLIDDRGVIQRVADYLKPAPKSVLESYQPTEQELQAERDRRLSYGAGPISGQTAAKADLARSGIEKADSKIVAKVAKAMDEQGTPSFGDMLERAKSPELARAAREAKADEFRTPGEWAVDTLSNLSQGGIGLVQLPINIIAPSSDVAETLRETQKELQAAESDVLKANRERLKERVLSENGFFDRYVATVKELVTNPTLSLSEAAKQVPNFLGVVAAARAGGLVAGGTVAAAGRVSPTLALGEAISGGAIQTAARAAGTTAGGAGASMVMAGGDAAGDVYETLTSEDPQVLAAWQKNPDYIALRDKKMADGMDRKDAAQQAIEELATTKARMAAMITAPLGLLGYMGAEAAVASKGLGRATAEALTTRGMAKSAAKDLAGEQLEEGGTQFGANVAKQTVNPQQSLAEGVPEAMGTALVTSAPFTAMGVRSQYKEAMQNPPDDLVAGRIADVLIGQERQDSRLINPADTIRQEQDVGPSAPAGRAQVVNFTEPDSATAQAGLTPIVVPVPTAPAPTEVEAVTLPEINQSTEREFGLDALRMGATNVSTASAAASQPAVGGIAGSNQLGGGLDVSGSPVAGAAAQLGGRAGVPAADAQQVVAAGDRAGQQAAAVAQPSEQWFGRKGDGYITEGDAQQALPGRKRMFPSLDWKVEQMPSGKFRLAGYSQETALGTQTTQAIQAEAQGQEARAATAGAVAATAEAGATTQLQGARAPELTLAKTAPIKTITAVQNVLRTRDNVEIEPVTVDQMSNQHKLASVVANMLGKTFTVVRYASGDRNAVPNGMINDLGGNHIFAAEDTVDAPLFVAMHEAYHGLPEKDRKALNTQLLTLFREENKQEFLTKFNYTEADFSEEAPAFMAQVISKRADFWEELRTKMGNKEFASVAKIIIDKLGQIVKGVSKEYGDDFANQYIKDIVQARSLLSDAYAKAMQERGLKADIETVSPVASKRAGEDIGAKLQARVDTDFEGASQEYAGLKGTKGGRLLDTDIARELSPEYRENRNRSAEVHEAASAFIQRTFETRMAQPGTGDIVAFMAGGGGAGKSSAEKLLAPVLDRASTVLDGTLSSYDKARRNVQLALDSGRHVRIAYVYREPVEALRNGVLTRAMDGGRTVPVDALVKGHAGSSTVVRKLQEEFGDNPKFKILAIDNSRGPGNADIVPLESITSVKIDGLKERFINATEEEYRSGRISEAVYRATVGSQANTGAGAESEAGGREVRQGPAGPVQGRSGPERAGDAVTATRRGAQRVGDFDVRTMKDGSIVVYGDPDAIRSQIPEDVKGRVTKDGIVFTTSAAPRVKAALEGRKTAYSRGGAVLEKLPMKDGKYVGAPEKFNTPGKIPTLRKWLRQLANEGGPGRYWYENSSREVLKMVGGDVQEARKFVALLAIYSPQAKVDANSTFALRAWAQYKAGQPIAVKTGVMDKKAQGALDDVDAFWSGEKTGNFFFNLLREIDPSTAGKQGATIDMWMMRAGQYDTDAPTATQYAFMENETNRLAAELGWEPQQVQAAIWVAMKARMENTGVKKRTEATSEKKGWIRYDYPLKNGRPVKTRVILNDKAHRDNWLKHSFEHDPTKDDTQQAKFDFGDGLKRHIGQISFEARPGRSTGALPGIHSAPYAQQVEFQQAVQKAFYDEQGNDLLAMKLGLLVDTSDILLPGVWQGEVSPSSQKLVAMAPAKGEEGKANVDPAQAEMLNVYAAVAGLVAKQEGVGWHRPFYAGTKRDSNGVDINIGRALNPREAADLETAIGQWMTDNGHEGWQDQFALISSPNGIRLVNFGIITNEKLHSDVVGVAESVLPDGEVRVFASSGDMPTNDWKENPNGETYVQRIGAAGRSDILNWARDFLAPRVQRVFKDFSERYDWGDPGTVRFSNRAAGPAELARGPGARADEGTGRTVTGIHYGKAAGLSRLSGVSFGTGIKGAEQARLNEPGVDPRIKKRVYFYLTTNPTDMPRPEIGLGAHVYRATLGNMFDMATASAADKQRVMSLRKTPDANGFESAILDAGFRGYVNREMQTAVVLNSDVPVAYEGLANAGKMRDRIAERVVQGPVTRESGDELVRKPTNDEMMGIINARAALAEAAPSFRLQYGEARVAKAEADAADQVLADAGSSFQFGDVRRSNRVKLAEDAAEQERFLQGKAEEAGYADVDEFMDKEYDGFVAAAAQWREENPAEVMFSKRSSDSWFLGRDELGRIKFGAGAKAYRAVADVASNVLDKVGMKPISTELGRAMRQMKVEIAKAREITAGVATKLSELSEQERAMISDVIEKELKRGVKPPKRVLEVAASMKDIMSEQTAELVRLGMLSADAAGRWDGKYLPRFYESKLKDEGKAWAKAAKALFGKPKAMQGIGGSSLKGRGLFQTIPVEELEQWVAEGWEERDPSFDPEVDTEITVWRDYTREERENMGEIRDAMFRFIMGYNKSQRDISLGRLYENLANTVASKFEKDGYVQVPSTNVEDTRARRYGKLAGKWVPREVMDHLSGFDEFQNNDLMRMYVKAMSMWKEGKTVLNPVSHANNVLSNVTMAHFAGVSYWDVNKYVAATRDIIKNAPMLQEAKDAGLWLGTMTQSELVEMLPDQLKVLAAKQESKSGKVVDSVWNAMSFWLRKPLGKAYEVEDLYFRYLIYRDARQRGVEPADAVDYAQKYIFTYDDLPKTARRVRDFALPFFAYTYKVVPALAQTALEHPWRLAAPAAVLYTVNTMMYAFAAGADDDDWMEVIKRYMTDADFREQARQMEAEERINLPPWMKGATAIGTPKTIRLGTDEATDLPVFLDVARIFPGGDLFDAHNNAGGVPLLAPITPNHPVLTSAAALLFNKDTFRGTEIVKASDTDAEAAAKRAKWAYQQVAPAIAIGNSHFDRAMNVIANATGEPVNLFFTEYTGVDRGGQPVQAKYAAMQTVGVKARPIDLETSKAINEAQQNKLIREIDAEIRSARRLERKGAITEGQAEAIIERQKEKRQRLKEGLTIEGEEQE